MSELTCIAKIISKSGYEELVKAELSKIVAPTRQEQGCLNYDMHLDNANGAVFMFHETWESEAFLDQHLESDHIKNCFDLIGDKLESVEIHRLTKLK
ncbi:putative quinol monooxygenase [Hahella ganghwensis]|uniref:putative quinol monooxygenase n=1 Tax=Hahella ganghwensis TaxID=286420 RepID=UPI00036AEE8C|nr:putative quinol monooxygenase [Hahella ganghwensis]